MAKVTDTKCVDGKRHSWKAISIDFQPGNVTDTRWCRKCGCLTEFAGHDGNHMKRCKEEDKTYYVEIPKIHRVWG
jgi:hypothetical protein